MNCLNRRLLCCTLCCLLTVATPLLAQHEDAAKPSTGKPAAEKAVESKPQAEAQPVQTHHTLHVNGQTLNYTATAGMMPLKNDRGETEANIFFMAYTLDQPEGKRDSKRPLMFAFNGGPGSASVWLHLGAIGPRTVHMQQPDGTMPAPPYQVEDNENTWLTQTDLVFIDPVGTGYSRVTKPELLKSYLGLRGDTAAVGKFIRLYLDRYERWNSPLFLVGESYGTTRASALSGYMLQKYGVAFNGIVLMSTVLNFETLEFATGNDLPYVLFLPTYTATAWYHKKLDPSLQGDLQSALRQAEAFADGPYADALAKGDRLSAADRASVIAGLAKFTGLSAHYIDLSNLRVDEPHFTKELLRDEHLNVGRLDSRYTGYEPSLVEAESETDPTMSIISSPFSASFHQYIRTELGYKSDDDYYLLGGGFSQASDWDWGSAAEGFPNVTDSLRNAFAGNPYMRLYVASGYFDLATPYFATEYTLAHLGLEPSETSRISTGFYDAGHMMYLKPSAQKKLHDDVAQFIAASLH
ncbi:MAG TPA: peptidase S10 [Acidobacteriaceae bacterium]|nr:peptidase S10 [Acidobacteriaceae bacterium]